MNSTYNIFSKPTYILYIINYTYYFLLFLSASFLLTGLYLALNVVPQDFQQGEVYRILYIHVPSAWLSTNIYNVMSVLSLFYLVKKHPLLHYISLSLSASGVLLTLITLISGSIWGKPMWGTWWVWDARLTSVLILLLIYIFYIILATLSIEENRKAFISSLFCILGCFIVPIIKFSVDWWNTLHQPASISQSGASIHESMIYPLLITFLGIVFYVILITSITLKYFIINKKIDFYRSSKDKK